MQPLLHGVAASTAAKIELTVEGRAEEVGAAHAPAHDSSVGDGGGGGGAAWRHVWRGIVRRRGACGGGEAAQLAHLVRVKVRVEVGAIGLGLGQG